MDKAEQGLKSSPVFTEFLPLSPPWPYAQPLSEGTGLTVGPSAGTLVLAFEPLPGAQTPAGACSKVLRQKEHRHGGKPRHPGLPFLHCHVHDQVTEGLSPAQDPGSGWCRPVFTFAGGSVIPQGLGPSGNASDLWDRWHRLPSTAEPHHIVQGIVVPPRSKPQIGIPARGSCTSSCVQRPGGRA